MNNIKLWIAVGLVLYFSLATYHSRQLRSSRQPATPAVTVTPAATDHASPQKATLRAEQDVRKDPAGQGERHQTEAPVDTVSRMEKTVPDTSKEADKKLVAPLLVVEEKKNDQPALDHQADLASLQEQLDKEQQRNRHLEKVRENLEIRAGDLNEANRRIQALAVTVEQLQHEQRLAEEARRFLEQQLVQESRTKEEVEAKATAAEQQLITQEENAILQTTEITTLQNKLAASNAKLASVEEALNKTKLEAEALFHFGQEKDLAVSPCIEQSETLKQALAEAEAAIQAAKKENADLLSEDQDLVRELVASKESEEVRQREFNALQAEQEETAATLVSTREQLQASQDKIVSLEKDLASLNQTLEDNDQALRTAAAKQEETEKFLQSARQESDDLKNQLAQAGTAAAALQTQIAGLSTEKQTLSEAQSALAADLDKTKQAVAAQEKISETLKNKESELSKARKAEESARTSLTKADKEIKDRQAEQKKTSEALQASKESAKELEKKIASLEKTAINLKTAQNDLAFQRRQEAALQEKYSQQVKKTVDVENKLTLVEQKVAGLEEESRAKEAALAAHDAQVKELTSLVQEAKTAHEAAMIGKQQAEERLAADAERIAELETTLNQKEEATAQLQEQVSRGREDLKKLQIQLEQAVQQGVSEQAIQ